VTGFAQRTGVISGLRDAKLDDRAEESGQQGDDRQSILLFGIGAGRRMAIPLSQVARLEEIPRSDVEWADGREVVQYRGQIMPLVCLADALGGGRAGQDHDPMQVIVYARGGRSVGLVVSEIFDIVSTPMQLQESRGFGLLGSAIVQQRVIDLIDVTGLIRSVDPEFLRTPEAVGA
jgi:two-component system chemotaxis sensor kinase CheA